MNKIKLFLHHIPALNKLIWEHPEDSIPFSSYEIVNDIHAQHGSYMTIRVPLTHVEVIPVKDKD